MLWLITGKQSHQITSCNIHSEGDKHQLWVERTNGKSMKVTESDNYDEVREIKEAIDYAVINGIPSLELN